MSADSLTADELIVEAEYFLSTGEDEPSLSQLHDNLQILMRTEGYWPENPQKAILSPKSIRYIFQIDSPEKTRLWKLKEKLGLADENRLAKDTYLNRLERLRDDVPFKFRFRTIPVELEDERGIHIEAKVEPAVFHKHEQIERQEDYNTQNVVRSCKEKLEDIATEMGWERWREPYTRAENLSETLHREVREALKETKWGSNVIRLTDEGDEAFRYHLLHPALGAYIHAIEWAIISYLQDEHGKDLIEEEITDGFGYNYGPLVDKIKNKGATSQKTQEELDQFVTYRRWMGHHKSGELTEANVTTVKQRLGTLLEELFL